MTKIEALRHLELAQRRIAALGAELAAERARLWWYLQQEGDMDIGAFYERHDLLISTAHDLSPDDEWRSAMDMARKGQGNDLGDARSHH